MASVPKASILAKKNEITTAFILDGLPAGCDIEPNSNKAVKTKKKPQCAILSNPSKKPTPGISSEGKPISNSIKMPHTIEIGRASCRERRYSTSGRARRVKEDKIN